MRTRRAISASVIASALVVAPDVLARDRVALAWVRAPGAEACATAATIAREAAKLAPDVELVGAGDDGATLEALVSPAIGGYRVDLKLATADGAPLGQRTIAIEGTSCDPLTSRAALAIALLVAPREVSEPAVDASARVEPSSSKVACPSFVVAREPPPSPRERATSPARVDPPAALELGGGLAPGVLPGGAPFAELALRLFPYASWSPFVAASYAPPEVVVVAPGARATFSLAAARAGLCRSWSLASWLASGPCGALTIGSLRARGDGFASVEAHDDLYASASLSLRSFAAWRRRGLYASLDAGAELAFVRHPYRASDPSGRDLDVLRSAPIAARFAGGVGIDFP